MDQFLSNHLNYKRLHSKDLRVFLLGRRCVKSIQVAAETIAAEVAFHNTVWIDHRYDVKDALLQ